MNYLGNMKQKRIFRRIVISWIIVLMVGFMFGFGFATASASKDENISEFKEVQSHGTTDKTFDFTLSEDWKSGAELGFIPLEIEMDEELQEFIYCLSYECNIDYSFIMGLIQTESQFNPNIISSTNDYGLMQINKVNHKWLQEKLGITDFLDPHQNVRAGTYILRNLFEKYENPELVLMAYNMGENGAKKLWDKGIYESDYTNKVFSNAQIFSDYIQERDELNE